jgi:hypothetical protein
MKRVLAAAAFSLAFTGAATAATWTAPDGSFSFDKPKGWPVDTSKQASGQVTLHIAGTADEECWFLDIPRAETATASAAAVAKSWAKPLDAMKWSELAASQKLLGGTATVKSSAVDTSKPFPVQTAVLQGKEREVVAALHARPGKEIWVFCGGYDGKDRTAAFKATAGSVATPKDAEYAASIAAAAPATPAPAPAPQ